MSKQGFSVSKKIIVIVLVLAVITGAVFVLKAKKYEFDYEGRLKLLDKTSQVQKKYPNATVLIPDDSTQLPKSVPSELSYPKAKVASMEQLSSRGISFILISPDSKDVINKTMSKVVQNAGWKIISESADSIEVQKGIQKTKIFLEKEQDHTVITVAYTYDL